MMKSRRMRWGGAYSTTEVKMSAYRTWVGKPEGKRPLGKPRHRWVDNIEMYLKRGRMGWYGLD
jgi:hypothetical protein